MKDKIVFLPILLLFTISLNSQTSVVENDIKNPFFEYKSRIYNPIWSEEHSCIGVFIDTLNICRIKQSKIKSLKIYYFKSSTDSLLWRSYNYDTNGFIINMNPIIGWYGHSKSYIQSGSINCDKYNHEENDRKKRKYHILDRYKELFEYDSSGYLTKYSNIKLGIINRWLSRIKGGGAIKYTTFYDYSEDYTTVSISHCHKSRLISKKCNELHYDFITCEFDKKGNLLQEMKYSFDENENANLIEGFKYKYNYFK